MVDIVPLTEEEVLETQKSYLRSLGIPVDSWVETGLHYSLMRGNAVSVSSVTDNLKTFQDSLFLDTAKGDSLTKLAFNWYQIQRLQSQRAEGKLFVYNPSSSPLTTAIEVTHSSGIKFLSDETTYPAKTSVETSFWAESDGPEYNVGFETLIAPNTVTISRSEWLSQYGRNEETDNQLAARCRNRWSENSLVGGPEKIEYRIQTEFAGLVDRVKVVKKWGGKYSVITDDFVVPAFGSTVLIRVKTSYFSVSDYIMIGGSALYEIVGASSGGILLSCKNLDSASVGTTIPAGSSVDKFWTSTDTGIFISVFGNNGPIDSSLLSDIETDLTNRLDLASFTVDNAVETGCTITGQIIFRGASNLEKNQIYQEWVQELNKYEIGVIKKHIDIVQTLNLVDKLNRVAYPDLIINGSRFNPNQPINLSENEVYVFNTSGVVLV